MFKKIRFLNFVQNSFYYLTKAGESVCKIKKKFKNLLINLKKA